MLPLPLIQKLAVVIHALKNWSICQFLIYPTSASSVHLIILGYNYLQQSLGTTGAVIRTSDQLLGFLLKNLDFLACRKNFELFLSWRHYLTTLTLLACPYTKKWTIAIRIPQYFSIFEALS